MSDYKYRGKIKFFDEVKGFGFIISNEFPKDVYFRAEHVFATELKPGEVVLFDAKESTRTDKAPSAYNINLASSEDGKVKGFTGKYQAKDKTKPEAAKETVASVKRAKNKDALHLYMPWNPGYIADQMFQLKNAVEKDGHAWIPKFNKTKGKDPVDPRIHQKIKQQLDEGVETCIYMTNFKSIHVWKLEQMVYTKDFEQEIGDFFLEDYRKQDLEGWWFKVVDLFVITADHDGRLDPILKELEELCLVADPLTPIWNEQKKITPYMSGQVNPAPVARKNEEFLFPNVLIDQLKEENSGKGITWLNTHRSVTKEYALMEEHLKKNCYPNEWISLSRPTRHMLTEFEMLRIEASAYTKKQRFRYLRQAFTCYLSAVLNQLESLVGTRMRLLYKEGFDQGGQLEAIKGFTSGEAKTQSVDLLFYITHVFGNQKLISALENYVAKTPELKEAKKDLVEALYKLKNTNNATNNLLVSLKVMRNYFAHTYFDIMSHPEHENVINSECEKVSALLNTFSLAYGATNPFYALAAFQRGEHYFPQSLDFNSIKNLSYDLKKAA